MSNQNNTEQREDYSIETVKKLGNEGNLVASLLLCSAFVEHYCKTRLFIFLTSNRPIEIIRVRDKKTKEMKNAAIWCKMKESILGMNQARVIDVGLLVGAWNYELWTQLRLFNKNRNNFVHQHEYILKMLKKDDEEKAKKIIEQGLALLHNIKFGYMDSRRKVVRR